MRTVRAFTACTALRLFQVSGTRNVRMTQAPQHKVPTVP
jgi:hypothetical protein